MSNKTRSRHRRTKSAQHVYLHKKRSPLGKFQTRYSVAADPAVAPRELSLVTNEFWSS